MMLDFIITNYLIFIVIAVVLLLGLFGYMMDRKKYEEYRKEILEADGVLNARPDVSDIATPISVDKVNITNNEGVIR